MTFLAGLVAAFAALGAIPILIHLLNKRRFRTVVWAAMDFLLATLEQNSRRIQMRDLILMTLRTLAVVLFALALARPTIAPGQLNLLGHQGEIAAVVVLDQSLSMGHDSGAGSRFDLGKKRATEVVDQLPKGSAAALVLMDDSPHADIAEPTHDLSLVGEEIARAAVGDGGTDVQESLALAWSIARKAPAVGREIYVVTDLQTVGWPAADEPTWSALLEEIRTAQPECRIYICDVGDEQASNIALDELIAEDELAATEGGGELAVLATVRNHAPTPATGVPVDLLIAPPGGELRKVASTVLDTVDGTRQVRLSARVESGGEHRIEVVAGVDGLGADNRRGLVLDVVDQVKVLIIDGEPSATGKRWDSEGFFLGQALSLVDPRDEASEGADGERPAQIAVDIALPGDVASLADYHAVVLANVGDLSPSLIDALTGFVRVDGKGLFIACGDNVLPDFYNAALLTDAGLMPARLGEVIATPVDAPDSAIGFATTGLVHPIAAFLAGDEAQRFLSGPRFHHRIALETLASDDPALVATGDQVGTVLSFADGAPALVERTVGRGAVLLFASAIDREWSDFPLRPVYLMLMRRAVQRLALGRRGATTVLANEPLVAFLPARDAGQTAMVHDPRAGSRRVPVESAAGGVAKVADGDTRIAGFWRIELPGENGNRWYAVNHPRGESAPERIADDASLRSRQPALDAQWIGRDDDLASTVRSQRVGSEIWGVLITLVAICLGLESWLAQRWSPKGT
ncbi:MAG TPA: BatA and WFA domain-containing protein [Planctomycetota bacterium]|nr:BatA and WFA domain-containing protein [Planctomycetota bacterium]